MRDQVARSANGWSSSAICASASVRTDHEFLYSITQQKIFNCKYVMQRVEIQNSQDTSCL